MSGTLLVGFLSNNLLFFVCKIVPHITPLLANIPQLQAIQIAASAQVNEDFYDLTDIVANAWREHSPSLKRVTSRDMSCWTNESPATGLLSFRLEDTRMVPDQPTDSARQVELLNNNMSQFPVEYLEEDIPLCFEKYAWTWRTAFFVMHRSRH